MMRSRSIRWQVAKVLSPLICALVASAIWPDLIKLALGSGHAITFVILTGIAVGTVLIVYQSLRVNKRWDALRQFIAAVEDQGRDWRTLPYVQTTLGKVLLRQEMLALGQEALEKDVQDLRVRVYQAQILPDFLVGLMVALGLVGTFIGLIYTLGDVGGMLAELNTSAVDGSQVEQVFGRLVAQLQSPLTAMGTAFAASLFGLVGSILLGLMMVLLRGRVEDYIRAVRKFMLECLDVRNKRLSIMPGDVVNEQMLARQVHHLGELVERLAHRQAESLQSHEALQRQLAQAHEREERVQAGIEARFEQIGDWQDATIAQVNAAKARTASIEEMLKQLIERGGTVVTAVRALADASAEESAELRRATGVLADLGEAQKAQGLVLEQCAQGLTQGLEQAPRVLETLQAWNQAVGAHQDARLQAFDAQLQVIRALLERAPVGSA
ncbi:hypothetical protein AL520_02030 [Achromobacter xylosoxidans]|nr:hypothetical protein AL520_02030 [Achromobacter xylosoxidans]